ncbi:hypothetical protein [Jannaschia sp. 2305UL9-9]|uniref:hypothetical protein n=1 Tax=Jannaschia sp. 2305UL9-9 TaxID=3121638 RepID=UPI003528FDD6
MNKGARGKSDTDRDARLKAALKANMGRRKAQARARADEADTRPARKEAEQEDDIDNG